MKTLVGSKTSDGATGATSVVPELKVSKGFKLLADVALYVKSLLAAE